MSSDDLNPISNAPAWDKLEVGQTESPGLCKLTGFRRGFGWDVKQGKGVKGSTVTLNTYPPAEGTVTFFLWEAFHFDEWRAFRGLFKYDGTRKDVTAIDVYHPSLADIEVRSVVCKSISAIEPAGKGLFQIVVELIEYNPPPKKNATRTPDGSKSDDGKNKPGGAPPDARQAIVRGLADDIAQAQKP